MEPSGKVNILVVDDRPDRVLALSAVLESLGETIVGVNSGREALRRLLTDEFAVILLDINMPGMDGFETARLIRERPSTRDIPIIFVTAYQDELQLVHSYSLRAVDYIQIPVVPEILRTKVGVLVDLYKKTAQLRRQADWLRQRAAQLHKLSAASLAINSAHSLEALLGVVTQTARDIVGVSLAAATAVVGGAVCAEAASCDERLEPAEPPDAAGAEADGMREMVRRMGKPVRMSREELDQHPAWSPAERAWRGVPLRGWLAVPLTGRDGANLGWIEVSHKIDGDFTGDDEAVLLQIAQMAAIAIENVTLTREREVNRLKDEFLWTLSHELRTPLNAILGWSQLLRMGPLPTEAAHGVDVIDRNARAQAKLVDDMLDLSRIIMGKLRLHRRTTALAAVIEAAVENVRPLAAERGLSLECVLPAEAVRVDGDPDRLQQVVGNLLSNALKFTPRGGQIRVELQNDGPTARIRVRDTGQGIRPEFLSHVFDRFRQADSSTTRAHGGLGIGLTIVRHIAELHGGSVRAESAGEGCGATFTVELPLRVGAAAPGDAPEPQPASASPAAIDLSDLHVLVVDDDPDALRVCGELLKRYGAQVTLAASAAEALDVLHRAPTDLLVSDIGMPGQDGYDLIRAVRKLPPDAGGAIPAVALTAYAREQDGLRAISAGFQVHLPKPIEPARLAEALHGLRPQPTQPNQDASSQRPRLVNTRRNRAAS